MEATVEKSLILATMLTYVLIQANSESYYACDNDRDDDDDDADDDNDDDDDDDDDDEDALLFFVFVGEPN